MIGLDVEEHKKPAGIDVRDSTSKRVASAFGLADAKLGICTPVASMADVAHTNVHCGGMSRASSSYAVSGLAGSA